MSFKTHLHIFCLSLHLPRFLSKKAWHLNPFAKRVQDSQNLLPTFLKESRQRTLTLWVCADYISLHRPFYLCFLCLYDTISWKKVGKELWFYGSVQTILVCADHFICAPPSLPFGGGVSHRLTEGGLMYSYLSLSPTPSRLHRDTPPKEGALDCANSFVCTNETSPWRGREAAYTKPLPPGEVAAKPTERDDEDKDFRISWFVQTILVCADHFICAKVYVSFSPSVSPPM